MNTYALLTISGIIVYIICIIALYSYSRKETVSDSIVSIHELLQYICLSALSFAFISFLLYIQDSCLGHPISTYSSTDFISELMTLSFVFVIVLVYNLRLVRNFCQPIYTYSVVDKLHNFFLYLRPFKSDKDNFKKIIKQFTKISFSAVSIANPRSVVQNIESDKIFTDDSKWKSTVQKCMEKSQFIILNIGDTEGCLWEMKECSISHLGKTIFGVSSENAYDILKRFLIEKELYITLPSYVKDSIQLFFLKDPSNYQEWDSIAVKSKKEIHKTFKCFSEKRAALVEELNLIKEGKRHPFKSLFDDKYFPKDFGWLSLSGLSMSSFPFMGRLLPIYWIIYIPLVILLMMLTPKFGAVIMMVILTIFGKRMIWLSGKWAGKHSINSQINIIAIVSLICTIFSAILGVCYLTKNPIEPKSHYYTSYTYSSAQSHIDVSSLMEEHMSSPEYFQNMIKIYIENENKTLPIETEQLTIETGIYDSCMVTYKVTVHEEKGYFMSNEAIETQKKAFIDALLNDPNSKQFVTYCTKGDVSITYEYTNSITKNVVKVCILPTDLTITE